jgi:ribose transport system permease protein
MSVIAHDEQDVVVKDPDEGHPSLIKRLANTQSVWILGVLLVIIAFFSITGGSNFLSVSNFSLIAQNVSVWAVLGIGMTFVIITSGIDLSVGSVLVFSSVVAAKAMEAMGDGAGAAMVGILIALVSGAAWGCLNGFLVAKAKIPPLIVTLGSLSVALGLAQVITSGIDIRSVPEVMTDFNTYTKILGLPSLPFVALLLLVIGGVVLHKTKFGRYTYAVGSNEESARRVGVKVDRHLILIYALSGLLAGVGAIMSLCQFGTTTIAGQSLTNLNVIAAVVIGGTSIMGGRGSVLGTLLGALLVQSVSSGVTQLGWSSQLSDLFVGIFIIVAVGTDLLRARTRRTR